MTRQIFTGAQDSDLDWNEQTSGSVQTFWARCRTWTVDLLKGWQTL